jgi:uncharacterized protein (TIGR03086 family)
MESIADRYRRLAAAFGDTVAEVPPDGWATPTPCEGWTALDLVRHVVDSQNLFFGLVGKPPVVAPSVDDDPLAAWRTTSGAVLADLEDPVASSIEFDGFFGRTRFDAAVDRFLSLDLVVHRWDLAHALGLDDTIAPGDIATLTAAAEQFGEAMRSPGAFGPALEAPEGADEQTRLLALLGRRP